MIVAETADGYQFVTQPDHAALAGQFADAWGGESVDRPDPFDSLALAAYAHDTGWRAYDRRPHLTDGEPVDFREMPAEPWIGLYDEGIDAVAGMDAYAGLLVSMHGAGLRNRRYGLSPEWPETPPEYREFVDREAERQRRLLGALLHGERDGPAPVTVADRDLLRSLHHARRVPEGYDGRLWADYRRLQAWDALSLSFCITDTPPGYGEIGAVPTTDGDDATLSPTRVADGEYRVAPYPFGTAPLEATVPVRTVGEGALADEETLARAFYDAGRELRRLTLRPPAE
ncbi:DUF3891 family protein [Halosimplex rubrum]|uniref:DUF3891 family protein n=1 Tax=Halosimplex rubrum TaxID=869889 RepID=A0A7D5SY34_9EURY|nr:DUF3891 family protein [Halosimplex rubrum]QLH77611.1 DUF3891 family protein [Halosimplex rubrum]